MKTRTNDQRTTRIGWGKSNRPNSKSNQVSRKTSAAQAKIADCQRKADLMEQHGMTPSAARLRQTANMVRQGADSRSRKAMEKGI